MMLIKKGIDVNYINHNCNALYWCRDYPEVLKMLIDYGIDINFINYN